MINVTMYVVMIESYDGREGTTTSVDRIYTTETAADAYCREKNKNRLSAYDSEWSWEEIDVVS